MAMSCMSKNKELAWKFISHMTDKERTTHIQGTNGSICARKSVNSDPDGMKNVPPSLAATSSANR